MFIGDFRLRYIVDSINRVLIGTEHQPNFALLSPNSFFLSERQAHVQTTRPHDHTMNTKLHLTGI